jgi:hypothetical protein
VIEAILEVATVEIEGFWVTMEAPASSGIDQSLVRISIGVSCVRKFSDNVKRMI